MALHFVTTTPDDPRAEPLVDELSRDYDDRYGLNDGVPSSFELRRYPAELFTAAAGGVFVLVLDDEHDGIAVAGGAYKRVDANRAEIKRVWTSSAHRRRGLARLVMAHLEDRARTAGYAIAELTTGARQPEAVALYLALGYRPLFDLDGDWEDVGYLGFEKVLAAKSVSA